MYPQVVDHVTTDMKLAWEEQFGPVLPFMRVEDVYAAVKHCNDSKLALQGCVFSADINTAMRMSDAMKTGTVQVRVRVSARWCSGLCCSWLHSSCLREGRYGF